MICTVERVQKDGQHISCKYGWGRCCQSRWWADPDRDFWEGCQDFFVACHGIKVRSLTPRFWMRSTVERLCWWVTYRMTLPTTTCHSWHGHSWRHMTQLIYDLITDVNHLLVMGKSQCCGQLFVYLAQKNRSSCSMCSFQVALAQKQRIVASQDQAGPECLISIERTFWKQLCCQDDAAHQYISLLTASKLEATFWMHNQESFSCDNFDSHHHKQENWNACSLLLHRLSLQKNRRMQAPKPRCTSLQHVWGASVLSLNVGRCRKMAGNKIMTLLSGWCSPPVHLFANSLKTRGYLLNAQPRKFLLW